MKGKKIYMILDMEGISGVTSFDHQAHPGGSLHQESRHLMTGDVNAAIEGALEGGATEILMYDMHCFGINLILNDLHPAAKLIAGKPRQFIHVDESYDGMFLIGLHAMGHTPGGLLTHTYELPVKGMYLNGQLLGEIGIQAALAGSLNIPLIMISGDSKAEEEARQSLPDVEFAVVKQAVGMLSGICLAPAAARKLIKEKAKRAVQRSAEFKPLLFDSPVEFKIVYDNKNDCNRVAAVKGVERLDDFTVVMKGKTPLDAWRLYEDSQAEVDLT